MRNVYSGDNSWLIVNVGVHMRLLVTALFNPCLFIMSCLQWTNFSSQIESDNQHIITHDNCVALGRGLPPWLRSGEAEASRISINLLPSYPLRFPSNIRTFLGTQVRETNVKQRLEELRRSIQDTVAASYQIPLINCTVSSTILHLWRMEFCCLQTIRGCLRQYYFPFNCSAHNVDMIEERLHWVVSTFNVSSTLCICKLSAVVVLFHFIS